MVPFTRQATAVSWRLSLTTKFSRPSQNNIRWFGTSLSSRSHRPGNGTKLNPFLLARSR